MRRLAWGSGFATGAFMHQLVTGHDISALFLYFGACLLAWMAINAKEEERDG